MAACVPRAPSQLRQLQCQACPKRPPRPASAFNCSCTVCWKPRSKAAQVRTSSGQHNQSSAAQVQDARMSKGPAGKKWKEWPRTCANSFNLPAPNRCGHLGGARTVHPRVSCKRPSPSPASAINELVSYEHCNNDQRERETYTAIRHGLPIPSNKLISRHGLWPHASAGCAWTKSFTRRHMHSA